MPEVSFIIPAYNCESTLADSVRSILDGNVVGDGDIVIVDDGSTDGTVEAAQRIATDEPRVAVVRHRCNRGGGAARNTAVSHAKHDLVFCLDSDNLLLPESVPELTACMSANGYDVAAFQHLRFFRNAPGDAGNERDWDFGTGEYGFAEYLSCDRVPGNSGNYLFTRQSWERAGGYPEFTFLDTWGFGLRQAATGARTGILPGSAYNHRFGHESYWVRGNAEGTTSLQATALLMPFFDRIPRSDVEYVMGSGRYTWFEDIANRPLSVLETARADAFRPSLWQRLKRRLVRRRKC